MPIVDEFRPVNFQRPSKSIPTKIQQDSNMCRRKYLQEYHSKNAAAGAAAACQPRTLETYSNASATDVARQDKATSWKYAAALAPLLAESPHSATPHALVLQMSPGKCERRDPKSQLLLQLLLAGSPGHHFSSNAASAKHPSFTNTPPQSEQPTRAP